MSVAKPGNGAVDSASGFSPAVGADLDPAVVEFDHQPGLGERVERRLHVVGRAPMRSIEPPVIPAAQA
jgi:capsular polysaccharide biosynthesis protein